MRITNTRKAVAALGNRPDEQPLLTYREIRDRLMAGYVADVLRHVEGNKRKAAELLDVSYSTVKEKARPDFGCDHAARHRVRRRVYCANCGRRM